jgi:hypothetical protein
MSTASTPAPRRSGVTVASWIGSLFTLKPERFHPALGLVIAAIMGVPLILLSAVGHTELWLSFSFALLFTGISDVVVKDVYATRVRWSVGFVLVGALLTTLGYILGGASWILVALAIFVSTLLCYLAGAYGQRAVVAGVLLNIWFLIALSASFSLDKSPAQAWPQVGPQVLAWLAGGVLWMVAAWVLWMVQRARPSESAPPAQRTPETHFTRPLVAFAVLAAVAVALATAVAWGFDLPNAVWMPASTLVALKPSLQASAYIAGQRVAGAVLGAIAAGVLLSLVHQQPILILILVVIGALGVALHEVNYAHYCACIATVVLIALGLSHPGDVASDWERVAWTLAGVGIALVVMLVASLATQSMPQQAATA